MKKIMNWMLAAILICGASVFTACTSNESNPAPVPQPDINLAEKIVGKWMVAELDGEACPTNLRQSLHSIHQQRPPEAFLTSTASRGTTRWKPTSRSTETK